MLRWIAGILFLIFTLCKVFGVTPVDHWSWWWVTSPIWIGVASLFVVLFLQALIKAND